MEGDAKAGLWNPKDHPRRFPEVASSVCSPFSASRKSLRATPRWNCMSSLDPTPLAWTLTFTSARGQTIALPPKYMIGKSPWFIHDYQIFVLAEDHLQIECSLLESILSGNVSPVLSWFAAVCLALLAGCSGGGGGGTTGIPNSSDGNLHLVYTYPSTEVLRFNQASIRPVVNGLGSNSPHYVLQSGSFPSGLQLNGDTGEVSGVPAGGPQGMTPMVTLTVEGFSGSLTTPVNITVRDLSLWYLYSDNVLYPYQLEVGVPLPPTALVPAVPKVATLGQGIALSFTADVAEPLPPGLVVDSSTGAITGTCLQAISTTNAKINMTLVHNSLSYPYSTHICFSAELPKFHYPGTNFEGTSAFTFTVRQNQSLPSGVPVWGSLKPEDSFDTFVIATPDRDYFPGCLNRLPLGVALDATTGTLSGAATETGDFWVYIQATLHRGGSAYLVYCPVSFKISQ
jgi:hypothetical protein